MHPFIFTILRLKSGAKKWLGSKLKIRLLKQNSFKIIQEKKKIIPSPVTETCFAAAKKN